MATDRVRDGRERGFTLVEVAIILLVLTILATIMVPNIGAFNRLARFVKVKEDLMVLCTMMKFMLDDLGESAFYEDGGRNAGGIASGPPDRDEPIGLLIGDGEVPDGPSIGSGSPGFPDNWRLAFDRTFILPSDFPTPVVNQDFRVDTFANHLISNTPRDRSSVFGYRLPQDMLDGAGGGLRFDPVDGEGFNSLYAWRGPYINDRIVPDPWGNRYMSNVFALFQPKENGGPTYGFDGYNSAVVCYTAGPDEEVDTEFNQPLGWITGDDDMTAILHGGNW